MTQFRINCSYFWYNWSITGAAPPNTSTINRSRRGSKTASLGRQHTRTHPHGRVTTERFFPLAVRTERSHYFSRIYLRHRLPLALTAVSQNSLIVPAFIRLSNGLVGEVVNFRKRVLESFIFIGLVNYFRFMTILLRPTQLLLWNIIQSRS